MSLVKLQVSGSSGAVYTCGVVTCRQLLQVGYHMCTSVAGAALLGLPFAMALLGELLHSYTNSSTFDYDTLVLTTAPFGGWGACMAV